MKHNMLLLHVYSNLTFDKLNNNYLPGGPGYYVMRALSTLKAPIALEIISCIPSSSSEPHPAEQYVIQDCKGREYTTFSITYHGDTRLLVLEKHCGNCCTIYSGDAAIIAPVYWETCSHLIDRAIVNYNYVLVDLQGFVRLGRVIENNPMLVSSILGDIIRKYRHHNWTYSSGSNGVIIKASIEDLGASYAYHALKRGMVDVITLGETGSIVVENYQFFFIRNYCKAEWKTGAGDIFSAAIILSLLSGAAGLPEAVVEATNATSSVLLELSRRKGYKRNGTRISSCRKASLLKISESEAINILYANK